MPARRWCAGCRREMRVSKNGVTLQTRIIGGGQPGGEPYELVQSDLWECPGCGLGLYDTGGAHALAHHHEPDFMAQSGRLQAVPVEYHELARKGDADGD